MGVTNRVDLTEIESGDHLYTYRAGYLYAHHGICVQQGKELMMIHFGANKNKMKIIKTSAVNSSNPDLTCKNDKCEKGKHDEGNVVLSCLECFVKHGDLYRYGYGVSRRDFKWHLRGGTCTTAKSDPPEEVVRRANRLLREKKFSNYNVFRNNCEDFALYCKTSRVKPEEKKGFFGGSGQATWAANGVLSVGQVVTFGKHFRERYITDIGADPDAEKVAVEELIKRFK